ncbi:MAG TPA: HAMP domain-containing sensor histidine kinase [Bdellovibrionales bacterium]|nr:HAMP domain-containing sensor histidine kinase [Bdellovibrionales bacterium]
MADGLPAATQQRESSGFDAVTKLTTLRRKRNIPWKIVSVVAWLVFSVALATWILIFGLQQANHFARLAGEESLFAQEIGTELMRQHRMLMSEGVTLVLMLLGGGAVLLYYINTELKRTRRVQEFLGAFTHDLKTSLASLRLQAESLEEDLRDSGQGRLAKRLVKDTIRLELQLENSLLLAAPEGQSSLLIEPIRLSTMVDSLQHHWPELEILLEGDGMVDADSRALESVLKNVTQNAVVHGRASKLNVDIVHEGKWTRLRMQDDGRGFKGDRDRLGKMFERHSTTSGSGLGLYLVELLLNQMGGEVQFPDGGDGFRVDIVLPTSQAGGEE